MSFQQVQKTVVSSSIVRVVIFSGPWYKHIYFETISTTFNMIIVTIQNLRIGTEAHTAYLVLLLFRSLVTLYNTSLPIKRDKMSQIPS